MADDRQSPPGGEGGGSTDDAGPSACHPFCHGEDEEAVGEGAAGC